MRIPRYIVIKLEMVDKDTVKATEITDRCEIYEYEADEDEPQTETPYACGECPYHEQCSAEDWRSCRYDYVSGRYIDPQTERSE